MTEHHVTLRSLPPKRAGWAPTYELLLDGTDISSRVLGLNLAVDPIHGQRLELYLVHHPLDVELPASDVLVDADTHDVLVRLGWTPPAEEQEATG